MRILAINCGSSSLKSCLIDITGNGEPGPGRLLELQVDDIGGQSTITIDGGAAQAVTGADHAAATECVLGELRQRARSLGSVEAAVHRIVHGGERFFAPTVVTDEILSQLAQLDSLAPLHNPPAVAALRLARAALPGIAHVAVFDTAFHATLPPRAREYALPAAVRQRFAIRRYGFHGSSHAHVMGAVAGYLCKTPQQLRIVSCHLGNGASVTAIEYGRSVETSMGMTPLEGLIMGSRAGDLDTGIVLQLLHSGEYDAAQLDTLLNRNSGLKGLTGTNDLRHIEQRAAAGDETCRRAIAAYAHRVRKYIGAYAAVMGGVDAIAFTGGIGERSALMRNRILQRIDFLGARLDDDRNRDVHIGADTPIAVISDELSQVPLFVVQADEEMAMARAVVKLLNTTPATGGDRRVPIAVSARHAHLSQPTLDRLFGQGHELQQRTALSQPGQFSAEETVALIGPRGRIDKVRLMGPPRQQDQIEISRSDEFILGIDAPVRISGDTRNTPGITLEGPLGRTSIASGVICARRHIHMSPKDALQFGLSDHDAVKVSIDSDGRDLTFDDVTVRVSAGYRLELHLDTDEANAAGVDGTSTAKLLG